jgi:hypothetical protein
VATTCSGVGDEEAGLRGAGGDDDLAGLDLVDRDGDQIGAEGEAPVAGRDDGDGGAAGDGLQLVVVAVGEGGTERCGFVAGARFEPPEAGPVGAHAGAADQRLRPDVGDGDRLLAGEAVRCVHQQDPGLGVEDAQVEVVGRDRQRCADDERIDLPVQQDAASGEPR